MYEEFFGLNEKPFSIQPDPSFLYWGRGHRLAYAMLEYGVLNHAGISVITGDVGCGKTTLVHRLLDQLSDTHTVSLLSNIQAGRGELLSWVLMGFGQPFAGKTHVEMFSQLQSFFIGEYAKGKRIVLIIDEAQNLSIDMLEEIRLLSNINAGKDQLLQLILVGQPELKDLLNRPEMLQLAQRVGSDFHLTPLSPEEVQAYLDTRLSVAGCRRRLFTDRAVEIIAEQSRGVPRVINIIADTALVYAFSAEDLVVGVETIRSVVRDKIDYGVFGLASDENTMPPIDAGGSAPVNSFVAPARESDNSDGGAPAARPREAAPASEPLAPSYPSTPKASSVPASEATLASYSAEIGTGVATTLNEPDAAAETATISETWPESIVERAEAREETVRAVEPVAVTGVVIVGRDLRVSPVEAVKACGDGRAIVFAPVGEAPERVAEAARAGAVIADAPEAPFDSVGRARNAGYRQLKQIAPHMRYVQFLDSDAALASGWLETAEDFMDRRPEISAVAGTVGRDGGAITSFAPLTEKKEGAQAGEVVVVEGAVMVRSESFEAVGGYRGDLTGADTKDVCVRLRRRGGHVWRLEDEMTAGAPYKQSVGKWWSERVRAGFENAYCASLYGAPPERLGVMGAVMATFWGFLMPAAIIAAAIVAAVGAHFVAPYTPTWLVVGAVLGLGALIYVIRIVAGAVARGVLRPSSWRDAFFSVLRSFPELIGVVKHTFSRRTPADAAP